MKKLILSSLILCALLGGAFQGHSDVTVKVDSTLPWLGYMNVWQTNGTSYAFGSAWAIADLRAAFVPANSLSGWPLNTALVMKPNTNTYNPADAFWNYPDGSPNKIVEANFYRDVGTNFAGQTVTFQGTVLSNSMPVPTGGLPASGWTMVATIKEFTPTYGFIGQTTVPITVAGPFTVSRAIPAGRVCQYGFYTFGPNTAPGSANSLTGAGIVVEDGDPAITNQPASRTITSGTTTNLSVGAVGSAALTYQWKTNGVNLVNSPKFAGVTAPTLTILNSQVSDSAPYVVTVSNTVTHTTVDSTPAQLTVLDILITSSPVSQRVEQGSTVNFSVTATSSSVLSYKWYFVTNSVTNALSALYNAYGTNTPTLTLSNVQVASSGFYFVRITGAGTADTGATLLVKTYAAYANFLENPGFEADPTGVNESPWFRFETGGSFGHLQNSSDTYFGGGNVNVFQGTWVSYTTYNAAYSGIYQDVVAAPGQIFAADMWMYNASGDPIPGPSTGAGATNENYIEVQFRTAADGVLQQYTTTISNLTYATPQNVWFNMPATNAGTYGSLPPGQNGKYLVAPPGTAKVRFQLTMHDTANSVGAGSIYYDSASLMLKLPVTVTASQVGSDVVLSWKSQGATSYQVQYKDTIDGAWQDLGATVSGTGLVVTKSDPASGTKRFYRVLTL